MQREGADCGDLPAAEEDAEALGTVRAEGAVPLAQRERAQLGA